MKIASLKIILLTAGAVLFNFIFWQEKLAINALLFEFFICTLLLFPNRQ
jgi:hypothetical protein